MTTQATSDRHILVIDDDPFFVDFIDTSLERHQIKSCPDGKCVTTLDSFDDFDLVILDIGLGGRDGFELCKALRLRDKHIPVLFASGMADLESRLKAYGAGGNDYIAKPFLADELTCKVSVLLKQHHATQTLKQELSQASSLVMGVQTESAHLQVINRFVLHSSQCKDLPSLYTLFFHTLKELGSEGVLEINQQEAIASAGQVSRLEAEILEMSSKLPRIYSFGKRRAFFGWSNCRLLVRNIGKLIDIIAILMDSLEVCIERLTTEQQLVEKMSLLESYSQNNQDAIAAIFNSMTDSISHELLMLGIVSSLNEDEEERIKGMLDNYNAQVQAFLKEQDLYNLQLRDTVERMRQQSESFESYLRKIQTPDNDTESVELF